MSDGQEETDSQPRSSALAGEATKKSRRRMLMMIWIAVGIWTILLSVGTAFYAPAPGARADAAPTFDWRRGAVVFLFVGSFLAGWILLATRRNRRVG